MVWSILNQRKSVYNKLHYLTYLITFAVRKTKIS